MTISSKVPVDSNAISSLDVTDQSIFKFTKYTPMLADGDEILGSAHFVNSSVETFLPSDNSSIPISVEESKEVSTKKKKKKKKKRYIHSSKYSNKIIFKKLS